MKVAFFSDLFTFHTGYGENCRYLLKGMQARGHEVIQFAIQWAGPPFELEGIRVYPGISIPVIERGIDAEKPDILVHIRDNWVFIPKFFQSPYHLLPSCVPRRIAVVAMTPVQAAPVPPELAQTVTTEANYTIVQAPYEKKALVDMGAPPDRIGVLEHGVDPVLFHPGPGSRDPLAVPTTGTMLLNVGSNTERKNLPASITVLKNLLPMVPDAFLYLHTAITGYYGMDNHVRFHGLNGRNKVYIQRDRGNAQVTVWAEDEKAYPNIFRAADVYLSTTCSEGFGVPTLQALASGLPTFVTDTPIHRELYSGFPHFYPLPAKAEFPTPWGYESIVDTEKAAEIIAENYQKRPSSVSIPSRFLWPNIVDRFEKMLYPLVMKR